MRVVHLLATDEFDGPSRVAAHLTLRARARGESASLWSLDLPSLHQALQAEGLPDISGPLGADTSVRGRMQLAHALRTDRRAELIHAHVPWPDRLNWALLARGRRPACVTLHLLPDGGSPIEVASDVLLPESVRGWATHSRLMRVANWLGPLTLVTLTELDRRRVQMALPRADVRCVPNAPLPPRGVHPGWLPWGRCAVKILTVGRLISRKGFDRLLHVLASPPVRGIDFRLCVVGDGPERDTLVRTTAECELSEKVVFVGPVAAGHVFEQADVYMTLSRLEGMPLALLEAMNAGLAVVASPIGAHREVLADIPGALLSEQEQEWPEHVAALLTDPLARARIAQKVHERAVTCYSPEAQDRAYASVYASLMSRAERGREAVQGL